MRNKIPVLAFAATVAAICTSCVLFFPVRIGTRNAAEGPRSLVPEKVMIIGKIVLEPRMAPDEQKLDYKTEKKYRNMMWLICKDVLFDVKENMLYPESDYFDGRIEATLNKTFYAMSPPGYFVLNGGVIFVELTSGLPGGTRFYSVKSLAYPMHYSFSAEKNCKAVYIGTIKIIRDKSNKCTGMTVIDEYDREIPAIRRKFGMISVCNAVIATPETNIFLKLFSNP
jgi:hypothetical protein